MDEIELRLASVETALIEVFAWIDPGAIEDATASLKASLPQCDFDERDVRLDAVRLIDDGRKRFPMHHA